jgi:SNF2 family DNA or RNA helicase
MVACPKDEKLIDIIDTHEDDGRLVTYGGFTGTIDRIVGVYTKMKWNWIRVDGRGWSCSWGAKNPQEMLSEFQDKNSRIERCGFIGHPGSAGMGLTLTRSSETVFFSNDFNGESRIQSVDRIHRPGMDLNKGATITDLLHLPTDRLVLESHKRKQKLMNMSLGQFRDAMREIEANPLLERAV